MNKSFSITDYKEYIMIGKVFVSNGLNLVYGASGTGKTISTIKALNEEGITPYLLDFDDNLSPEASNCNFYHVNGSAMFESKESLTSATIPTNSVIVVDTWQLFMTNGGHIDILREWADKYNNTIIIIAHNKDLATRTDLPDMDSRIANHMSSKLFLEYDKGSKTKTNPRPEGTNLTVLKLRGYKGPRTIYNWMRD